MEDLGTYKQLQVLAFDDPKDLETAIRAIDMPSKIISIYASNSKHYAWIWLTRPIEIKLTKKAKKNKEGEYDGKTL